MQYLLAAVRKNSRRIHLENWLLLAVRTAAIVLAVVSAVAEPMIDATAWSLTRVSPRTRSWCSTVRTRWLTSRPTARRFDRAKQLAEQIVEERGQGTASR